MDRSKDFIQYLIDNPHNLAFKNLISYEDREDTINGLKRIVKMLDIQSNIKVNDTVYVITRYTCGNKPEIIECQITRITYKRRFSFSVKWHYANSNYYNANFTNKSIGKNVFWTRGNAEKVLENMR